jgi:hypothetical protein
MKISSRDVSVNAADIHDQAVIKDLIFLDAWGKGLVPWSTAASVVFRVRQIHRANPAFRAAHLDSKIASANNSSHHLLMGGRWPEALKDTATRG